MIREFAVGCAAGAAATFASGAVLAALALLGMLLLGALA